MIIELVCVTEYVCGGLAYCARNTVGTKPNRSANPAKYLPDCRRDIVISPLSID